MHLSILVPRATLVALAQSVTVAIFLTFLAVSLA
jgi:hypothetical protein